MENNIGAYLPEIWTDTFSLDQTTHEHINTRGRSQAMEKLTEHMNLRKSEGYFLVDIKNPEISLVRGTVDAQVFIVWQRKPMGEAIYG